MNNDIDSLLSSVFGARPSAAKNKPADVPVLTLDDTAPKKAAATPRPLPRTAPFPAAKKAPATSASPFDEVMANSKDARKALDDFQKAAPEMSHALDERIAAQRKEIEDLNANALSDLARIQRELGTPTVQNLANAPITAAVTAPIAGKGGIGLSGFSGFYEVLQKTVFGQDEYLQKLVIAFKRPYAMGHSGEAARNAFFVTGSGCTGKHLSLTQSALALYEAGVLASADIAWIDLALYSTPSEEKLFLQDLYMALAGDAEIIAFTQYEKCHAGFLTVLASLVKDGKSPLSTRYVLQNGRLIDAGTALVADAVSALTPRGKYLVLVSESPKAKLADSFGAPFVTALGDICETATLDAAALGKISSERFALCAARAKTALTIVLTANENVHALATKSSGAGAKPVLEFWSKVYRALAQYCLENEKAHGDVTLCVKDDELFFDFGKETEPTALFALLPQGYTGGVEEVKSEMDDIVGLADIKKYILSLEENFTLQAKRKAAGLKTASISMHMIFTGNPGTGKTTIARLVSKYLKAIGVLTGGQLVEVTRADLVGKYVGHTAPMTTQVLRSAIGGVLFIDEAYSLYRGKDDNFGLEAIDALVKGIEDNRDNLIVILAGYSKEMVVFLESNSGLKSRFPNIIEFPDYTGEELLEISKLQIKSKGYSLDERCDVPLRAYFNAVQLARARDAGNGRLARNKIEEAILKQAKRVLSDTSADLSALLPEDFTLDDVAEN